jgi:hypothetical protein
MINNQIQDIYKNLTSELEECHNQIEILPKGAIIERILNDKKRYQLSYREEGKMKTQYVPASEVADLRLKISLRKELKNRVKELEHDLKIVEILKDESKKLHKTYLSVVDFTKRHLV